MILAGDIGATKTYLGLFTKDLNGLAEAEYKSNDYNSLEAIIHQFLEYQQVDSSRITAACMGVAGPVVNHRCELTNIDWVITAESLHQLFHGAPAALLNDLEAVGYGVPLLSEEELVALNPNGIKRPGNAALIAAGTGLGEALLYWNAERQQYYPSASEGSHVNFGPRNEEEIELLRYLMRSSRCVSYEQVVSGSGLVKIYDFLKTRQDYEEPEWLAARFAQQDRAAVISETALAKENAMCEKALDMFVAAYGAEAGNLSLKYLSLGGIYLGGGITPKIVDKLREGTFIQAFIDKEESFVQLLNSIPVYAILNSKTGLLGAAWYAMTL